MDAHRFGVVVGQGVDPFDDCDGCRNGPLVVKSNERYNRPSRTRLGRVARAKVRAPQRPPSPCYWRERCVNPLSSAGYGYHFDRGQRSCVDALASTKRCPISDNVK